MKGNQHAGPQNIVEVHKQELAAISDGEGQLWFQSLFKRKRSFVQWGCQRVIKQRLT